jgi:hypothetical protein
VTWLAWRQFRANAALAALATAAVMALLVATRHTVAAAANPGDLSTGYQNLRLLGTGLVGVPAFVGAFWGAPLVAREVEAGTHRLAWTQSVTRHRWLATKLILVGLVAILLTGAFSLVFTWWSLPFDHFGNRIGSANFGQRGIVPMAYALFALALGTFAGTVLRRTLPAMATTLAVFMVVRFSFQWVVRPRLLAPVTTNLPIGLYGPREGASATGGGWIVSTRTVDGDGHTVTSIDRVLSEGCHLDRNSTPRDFTRCADRLGIHDVVKMHPADQFWTLQAWEAAGFVALAAALTLATFWYLRHRVS